MKRYMYMEALPASPRPAQTLHTFRVVHLKIEKPDGMRVTIDKAILHT